MRTTNLFTGAVVAAIAASVCCIGPVVLALTGLGSMALFSRFETMRPYLLGVSIFLLGAGFLWAWRNRRSACAEGGGCEARSRKGWLLAVIPVLAVLASAFFPYYSGSWLREAPRTGVLEAGQFTTVQFRVDGMTCESCASGVAASLRNLPGVKDAEVAYPSGNASMTYDPTKFSESQLAAFLREAGYQFQP